MKGTFSGPEGNETGIVNERVMSINGEGPHELNSILDNFRQLTIGSLLTGTGKIKNVLDSSVRNTLERAIVILDNDIAPIDLGVLFSNESKVVTEFGTQATITKNTDQFTSTFFGTGQLSGGEWIVKDQAKLNLKLDGEDKQFQQELVIAINKCTRENASNTPDFILADYLLDCLKAFDFAVRARTEWYKPPFLGNKL